MTMVYGTSEQRSVLISLEGSFSKIVTKHLSRRKKLWSPSDIQQRIPSRVDLDPEDLAILVLNYITESGLPYFFHLLVQHLGLSGPLGKWVRIWTGEEDRHGTILRDFIIRVKGVDLQELDLMRYEYLQLGFLPDWREHPYYLIAYTVLQERMAQRAYQYAKERRIRMGESPKSILVEILSGTGSDEGRHYAVSRSFYKSVLESDSVEALRALEYAMRNFKMPGASMHGFEHLAQVQMRCGVLTPQHYLETVNEVIEFCGIEGLEGLTSEGERVRDSILGYPKVLERRVRMFEGRKPLTVSFPFLPDWQATFL